VSRDTDRLNLLTERHTHRSAVRACESDVADALHVRGPRVTRQRYNVSACNHLVSILSASPAGVQGELRLWMSYGACGAQYTFAGCHAEAAMPPMGALPAQICVPAPPWLYAYLVPVSVQGERRASGQEGKTSLRCSISARRPRCVAREAASRPRVRLGRAPTKVTAQ